MRFQGKIKQWDEARGFGYIEWNGSTDKLFVHISAFADRSRRPTIGDIVTYEAERDAEGRHCAVKVMYPGAAQKATVEKPRASKKQGRGRRMSWLPAAVIAGAVAIGAQFHSPLGQRNEAVHALSATPVAAPSALQAYECAGKTRCNQMRSCEEAVFYLSNCPGTLADGDGDGVPCEDQWCRH